MRDGWKPKGIFQPLHTAHGRKIRDAGFWFVLLSDISIFRCNSSSNAFLVFRIISCSFSVLFLVRPSNAFSDYPEACQVGRAIFCFSTATFGIIHHNPVFYVLIYPVPFLAGD